MTNPTPMTPEAVPIHNGHMLLGNTLVDMQDFFLLPTDGADKAWRWAAYVNMGGGLRSLDGGTFETKARCLADALAHGCAPSAAWFTAHYPERTCESEAA